MIGTVQVKVQAATPNLPLQPLFAFKGSPSSLRIMDVPKSIGQWNINEVSVSIKYPDNSQDEKQAVRTGNVWVATVEGCEVTGRVVKGYEVLANGVDEDGNPVVGYVLGSGDVFVLERDSSIPEKDVEKFYVKFCETLPANPQKGDVVDDGGTVKMYDGTKWIDMGGGSAEEVGDATLTIKKNGINVGNFTANSFTNKTIDIPVPSTTNELVNDSGFITASAIPSNISSFNNDVGYITASEIPSSYSSISDASGNVINANRTIQRTAPGAAAWKLTQGGVTQTMTGTRTDSECEITVNGELYKNHLEWYTDPEYGAEGWRFTQWKWNGSGWSGGMSTTDSESITATSLSFYGYNYVQVTINWEEEQVIVSDTLVTQSQLSTMRSMTDLSYEQSFDKNNLEGIVSFNVVETSAPHTTIVLDKYDAASQTWSGDTQDWKVMWYYEGMGENVMFQLYHNNIGVQAFQAPAQGAGTTSWTFYGGGSPVVSGTLTMNMSDSLMTTNPVKDLIDSETKDKRDYNDISYFATSTTYSAYTYGIDKFTIETGWSNIWSADTSSAQVSGSTTTWALNNGLGVLTSDGQTFSLELNGSAIGTSFTMDDLKKSGVIQTTTIDSELPYQVTANAQFFKTEFAMKDALPSKTSDLLNDSGFITASAIPSNVGAFTNDVGYLTASSSALAEKRDYNDLTYPGTVYPSETHRIREFDLNIEGGYNPSRYTLNKFSTNVPNFGSMWANDEEYWNFAVATSNGEDFTFNKYGESGEVATFTMSDVTAGAITFTMTDDQIEYTCHLSASMYETTLALKDYVDSVVPSNTITISGIYSDLTSFAYNVYTT